MAIPFQLAFQYLQGDVIVAKSSITVTVEELPELLKEFPAALQQIQRLKGLDEILKALPQPPEMGAVTLSDKKLCMLENLWRIHLTGTPPWRRR
jgi:hypothetical protein